MRLFCVSCGVALAIVTGAFPHAARGDPLPGQILKFDQRPMLATSIGGSIYFGHDEQSTAYLQDPAQGAYVGQFMADDFADKFSTPVVHIRWWGSYMKPNTGAGVSKFLVAFENDVPVDPTNPFSHPGKVLLPQVVNKGPLAPGSGTFTESIIRAPDPVLGEAVYQYNAELAMPFAQKPDTVYWLKIVALVDPQIEGQIVWGWHNRDYTIMDALASTSPAVLPGEHVPGVLSSGEAIWHFQDDAVGGHFVAILPPTGAIGSVDQAGFAPARYHAIYDGPPLIEQFSKDLAFQLYTVPEPGTLLLLAGSILLLARTRRH